MTKSRPRNRPKSSSGKARTSSPGHGTWLWGQHAVLGALTNPRREVLRLLVTRNMLSRLPADQQQRATETGPAELDRHLPQGAVHQGVAAEVCPLPDVALEDLIAAEVSRIVVLDQLTDPHNLGAIFRSASAFGFSAIVLQTRNTPPITGVVAKSAAGAIETVAECRVVNISRALDQLNAAGFHSVGLDGQGRSDITAALRGATRLAVVLGAEGGGLRPGVARACAELARIPIASAMESLNVSNAAAIAFYEAQRVAAGSAI
jgi:23S rRNA (guanosine2251-2'-O)-methyltransferase